MIPGKQRSKPRAAQFLRARDQADLALGDCPGPAIAAKDPEVAYNAKAGLGANFHDGPQRVACNFRMQMQRRDRSKTSSHDRIVPDFSW